ncbi:MAG: hypothetical protein QXE81_00030 [Desulfurococcaceae archaeon]
MAYRYIIENTLKKMNILNVIEILDEIVSLGAEYVKICGKCRETYLCVYLSVFGLDNYYKVSLIGLSLQIPQETTFDNELLTIMKYTSTIVSENGMVGFYIPREYSMGVYYMVCRESSVNWFKHEIVEYEEIKPLESDYIDYNS